MVAFRGTLPPLFQAFAPIRARRWGALLALALLVLPLAGANAAPPANDPADFNLGAYKGKVVYLDFWASWCGPCKLSFPYMDNLAYAFPGKDLVVIAVNLDHSRKRADAFLQEVRTEIPVIYDPKGVLATRFDIKDMPSTVLIGKGGKVRYVHKGFYEDKEGEYTAHVSELVNEKP
jgi:cytochrome c biogenesis protein CcmG/thiol:disulfide interchange protein DsbE